MYEAETLGVRVRVRPRFLERESDPERDRFVWAYTITIENHSQDTVQLVSRRWRITDDNGLTEAVEGPGVVGEQPVLEPGQAFEYTSAAPLRTASGVMVGWYQMVRAKDRSSFEAAVPAFPLDSPYAKQLPN
ncbi:MAG: Co2+/Mg2+ efflux protein ApaG [Caulobacterales bacterium]|jgi:ApaG protein